MKMPVGLYYFDRLKRSSQPNQTTPVRVFTTSKQLDNPVIVIIDADGKETPMDRTEAVVTYLALGVALKTTGGD